MNRLLRLRENDLLRRLSDARRAFAELKRNPQRFGSKSVKIYRTFSSNAYDLEITNVGYNNRIVEITFTPDDTAVGLGGVFRWEYQMTYSGTGSSVDAIPEDIPPASSGPTKFRIYLSGSDSSLNPWARVKVWIYSNSSGTLSYALV